MILSMNDEGLPLGMIAKISKTEEEYILQVI